MADPAGRGSAIRSFTGRYSFLSNFFPWPVPFEDGIVYPTAEHAFQAQKLKEARLRMSIAGLATAKEAKAAGRRLPLRPHWDLMRKEIMLGVLMCKFTHADLRNQLAATGDALLVEGNRWHDNYWGDCRCGRPACAEPGENYLGQILMAVRMILREDGPGGSSGKG